MVLKFWKVKYFKGGPYKMILRVLLTLRVLDFRKQFGFLKCNDFFSSFTFIRYFNQTHCVYKNCGAH